jgi:basic amino acid/polyamine antiporter, APA family
MSKSNIWARKPVEAFEEDMRQSGLKRVLGKWGLTAIGIGAIIGTGIFVLTGVGARENAGPALALSFVLAGAGCAFAALCYAEFASFLPVEGSAYAYSYATMGEIFAWIIGWDLILEYAMGASAVAVGWSGYLGKFLHLFHGFRLPLWIMQDSFTAQGMVTEATKSVAKMTELTNQYSNINLPMVFGHPFGINLPAFLIIWVITAILVKGIKEAATANTFIVIIKLAVVFFVIIAGAAYIDTANWHPFIPDRTSIINPGETKPHEAFGWLGIVEGAAIIFFAYIGFDTVSTQAGEAKNPKKDVPFGIIVSLVICTILYILVALVLTGMSSYKVLDVSAPVAGAFEALGLKSAVFIITAAALAGLTSVLIVMLLGQSRVFYAMAKDGLLPKNFFGSLHIKFKTPYKASILTGAVVSIVSAFTPISDIAKLVNIGTLLAFVLVCGAVWIMRYKEPDRPRAFRTPYLPVVATLGILFNLGIMVFGIGTITWIRLVVWLAIGFVVYFAYGRHHSRLNNAKE